MKRKTLHKHDDPKRVHKRPMFCRDAERDILYSPCQPNKLIFSVKFSGLTDQDLRQVTVNTPIPLYVGVSKCALGNFTSDAHMM